MTCFACRGRREQVRHRYWLQEEDMLNVGVVSSEGVVLDCSAELVVVWVAVARRQDKGEVHSACFRYVGVSAVRSQ